MKSHTETNTYQVAECVSCGSTDTWETSETEQFDYGLRGNAVSLTYTAPVIHCRSCGFEFTDERAEEARHAAVCAHEGVLTPREVRAVRRSLELSQQQFADLIGVARASVARWESAQLIQNASLDNLIFLMSFQENIQRIRRRSAAKASFARASSGPKKFRALTDRDVMLLQIDADCFNPFAVRVQEEACT